MCKTLRIGMLALVVLGLSFLACDRMGVPNTPDNPGKVKISSNPYVTDLIAGQNVDAGDVIISFTPDYIYVEYVMTGNWWMTNAKFHIVPDSCGGGWRFPVTKKGNPIPGQFDYHYDYPNGTQHALIAVPWDEDWEDALEMCFAAHADLELRDGEPPWETQTGWGNGDPFPGDQWGMYFCMEVPKMLRLPTEPVRCQYTQTSGSTPSMFHIWDVPGDPGDYNVQDGYYRSFCLDRGIYIYNQAYSCRLWASYDPNLPDYCKYIRGTYVRVPYECLNYLVDKFMDDGDFSGPTIAAYQTVFWFYRGIGTLPPPGTLARSLYDEAQLEGPGWMPGPGDWYGVLLDIRENVQLCFILVDP